MAKRTSATQSTTDWGADHTGPFWAAQAFPPRAGQDHLGLGSVSSDRILARLSPGINVLTIHPRYWSFYAFVLDEFWAQDLPRTKAAFKDFYRPREAMFAFACQVCEQPEHATVLGNISRFPPNRRTGRGRRRLRPGLRLHQGAAGWLRAVLPIRDGGHGAGHPDRPGGRCRVRRPHTSRTGIGRRLSVAFSRAKQDSGPCAE